MKRRDAKKLKLLLIGPYPPPYGGIAITVFDLRQFLMEQDLVEVEVLNIGEGRTIASEQYLSPKGSWDYVKTIMSFARRRYLIHLETNGHSFKSWQSALVCSAAGLLNKRRTVIAFGSGNLPVFLQGISGLSRLVVRAVVAWAGIIVCRNDHMQRALVGVGADPKKIVVIPGFVGVDLLQQSPVPDKIQGFLGSHYPLFGATVYVPQGGTLEPEYGIPLLLSALQELRKTYPRAGAVIIGPGQEIQDQIDRIEGISELCMFTGPLSHDIVLGVMKQLTIFVRPTYFDGDSLSVREALALGIPVVATDTDFRPEGVIKFRKGEIQDLIAKLLYTLENRAELSANAKRGEPVNTADRVLRLYVELIGATDHDEQDDAVTKGVSSR